MNTSKDIPSAEPNFAAYSPVNSELESKFNILDRMAKKGDRWWFIALLIIGMLYVGYERWESANERQSLRVEILEVRNSQLAFVTNKNEIMLGALLNNTRALEANTQTLNRMENRKDRE